MAMTMPSRKLGAEPAPSEVRDLRLFVKPGTNPVADKLSNHAEPVGFDVLLNRGAHVADAVADTSLFDALV